jgi:hypothetical protein
MKYALLDTRTSKRSRLYSKKTATCFKQSYHVIITRDECINLGLLVEAKNSPVRDYIPIHMVKGVTGNSDSNQRRLNQINTENYEAFCIKAGTIIPV